MPRKEKSVSIDAHGVRVRLYRRERMWWAECRVGRTRRPVLRCSLRTTSKRAAAENATALAAEVAKQHLIGATADTLTLSELFIAYRMHRLPSMTTARQRESLARMSMFIDAWGDGMRVADIDQTRVNEYVRKRRALDVVAPAFKLREDGTRPRGYRTPRKPRDGALHGELSWLSTCCNWASNHRREGRRLLAENPLRGLSWPREKNPRRPVASHQRYLSTLAHVDAVDPVGRLRCILALARFTGRRESALCALRASDLLLTHDQITRALAAAGMDERLAEHMPHGAIRWRAEADKQGFLFISPVNTDARAALDAYLRENPRMGDVPLFPAPGGRWPNDAAPGPERSIRRDTALGWLIRAEKLAGLPKLAGGGFHPYRRLWASERKHMPDVDVAGAGGWRDLRALKQSYQQADPATVLRVVMGA